MRRSFLLLALVTALPSGALADSADTRDPIARANNQVTLDFNDASLGYTETGIGRLGTTPGKADTEAGGVPGFSIAASIQQDWLIDDLYASAQFTYNDGDTHYVGSTGGGAFGTSVGYHSAIFRDLDFRLGQAFAVDTGIQLTPFFGIGSHSWGRRVNAGEDYDNGYVGAGVLAQYAATDNLVLSGSVLGGSTFGSSIRVFGPKGFAGDLGDSGTVRLGLAADYALDDAFHINAGVDYAYYRYGESAVFNAGGTNVWEPGSSTSLLTFKIGVGYAF